MERRCADDTFGHGGVEITAGRSVCTKNDDTAVAIGERLVDLSRNLGQEQRGLAILGEGNVSADCFDGTFLVKASGSSLGSLEAGDLSRVRFEPILALLDRETVMRRSSTSSVRRWWRRATRSRRSRRSFTPPA